jgi:hypothetical protein
MYCSGSQNIDSLVKSEKPRIWKPLFDYLVADDLKEAKAELTDVTDERVDVDYREFKALYRTYVKARIDRWIYAVQEEDRVMI